MHGSVAAGAGRQFAPAAPIRPLGSRPELFVEVVRGLRGRAAPQLIRQMPSGAPPLDLTIADDLRRECLALLKKHPGSTLVLLKGKRSDDTVERWGYALYGPDQLKDLATLYAEGGFPLLHDISGMLVAIPQPNLLGDLKGRTLTRDSSGLTLVDRGDGI